MGEHRIAERIHVVIESERCERVLVEILVLLFGEQDHFMVATKILLDHRLETGLGVGVCAVSLAELLLQA